MIMSPPFYVNLCKALKIHPNSCLSGSSLPQKACTPERCEFLVRILSPFLNRVVTDHEMHNSFGLWNACFKENKFFTFVSIGLDALSFVRTHNRISCSLPFHDIVSQDDIDQFFSEKDWGMIFDYYDGVRCRFLSDTLLHHQVSSRASQKKHLVHLAILGGLHCLRGTSLVLDFIDCHAAR